MARSMAAVRRARTRIVMVGITTVLVASMMIGSVPQ